MKKDEGKYSTIHYQDYLKIEEILAAQTPRSEALGKAAHEEMLFIIVHQVYELWFKQIIHELESIRNLFKNRTVDESNIGIAVSRFQRVEEILKLLIQQVGVMETMTPLDFLDFRNYLFPASGFQSFQFRMIECLLGLPDEKRLTYHNQKYSSVFPEEQQKILEAIYEKGTIFEFIEEWLERTPFLQLDGFNFIEKYREALKKMLAKELKAIQNSDYLTEEEKVMRAKMVGSTDTYFQSILDKDKHIERQQAGEKRLSYEANLAALFINLYREEPMLHLPFRLLTNLMDIDDLLTTWRYRHAQMVLRMIGNKIGTGGSSGHEYLADTAKKHRIFTDFHNISTLLIPRSDLPNLPEHIKKQLNFNFRK